MKEITLATLDHLVLRAKQIQEIAADFREMYMVGLNVCSLAGERSGGVPSLHVLPELLFCLSMLANQQIAIHPRRGSKYPTTGSFIYAGVTFFALFSAEELAAYRANS